MTGDLIINAVWEKVPEPTPVLTYTVTFKDGNDVLNTQTVEHGKAAVAPENLTKEGFIFDGWDKAFDNVTGDMTVNATWLSILTTEQKQTLREKYDFNLQYSSIQSKNFHNLINELKDMKAISENDYMYVAELSSIMGIECIFLPAPPHIQNQVDAYLSTYLELEEISNIIDELNSLQQAYMEISVKKENGEDYDIDEDREIKEKFFLKVIEFWGGEEKLKLEDRGESWTYDPKYFEFTTSEYLAHCIGIYFYPVQFAEYRNLSINMDIDGRTNSVDLTHGNKNNMFLHNISFLKVYSDYYKIIGSDNNNIKMYIDKEYIHGGLYFDGDYIQRSEAYNRVANLLIDIYDFDDILLYYENPFEYLLDLEI